MAKPSKNLPGYKDESVPAHPGMNRGYPLVIFGDHRFCAGNTLKVQPMPGPHMHSQVELNFVMSGSMTYWFDGQVLTLSAGRLALFWGMIPHQVTECAGDTSFVVLYVPMAVFLELPSLSELRAAIFRGAVIEALDIKSYDKDMFMRWREDLLQATRNWSRSSRMSSPPESAVSTVRAGMTYGTCHHWRIARPLWAMITTAP